ncbi:MAG: hypothetical protein M0T81_06135 [Thermoplasmatales archaeon]|nr:hypothetical protein [Thermoplasmatales archaeon]
MIRKFPARIVSKRYSNRNMYFYLAVLLHNFGVLLHLKSRIRFIADVLRALATSVLVTVNPLSPISRSKSRASGGDF